MANQKSPEQNPDMNKMKESVDTWEVLQVPSASGQESLDASKLMAASQSNLTLKRKNEGSMERLLMDAQRESLQSSARQSLRQSKRSSPVFPDSPAESGDYFLGYDEFNRQILLSPSAADGSTDWFWDWNYAAPTSVHLKAKYHMSRSPKKICGAKRKFLGLLLLTNFLALILGAGLGFYLGRKILAGEEPNLNEWDIISHVESRLYKYD
ncbi:uncharacterized protein LOC129581785 [Paramacrobiotus metropolitanus]|uniref:uncharacterized protein LOC129581785 n=1 Tax=Paramacrobiotus metropolitanus TaxID=2943436 RepID=UPI002445B2DE|nr:uncharacterized protein LOC129581785 [Paramacrobiotus metropolitanus]